MMTFSNPVIMKKTDNKNFRILTGNPQRPPQGSPLKDPPLKDPIVAPSLKSLPQVSPTVLTLGTNIKFAALLLRRTNPDFAGHQQWSI